METLVVLSCLIVGIFIGLLLGKFKKPVKPKLDGHLTVLDAEEGLVVGLKVNTDAEILREQKTATFVVNRVAVNT